MNIPSEKEIQQAAEVIWKLPKGTLPLELFYAVAAKVTVPTMELAPLRVTGNKIEILLTKRPATDPYWPNLWHMTGTVIRANDDEGSDFASGVARVLRDELHGSIPMIGKPQFVGIHFWDVSRGRELDQMFYFVTDARDEAVQEGQFFDVTDVPDTTIEHHKIMIPEIVDAFKASRESL